MPGPCCEELVVTIVLTGMLWIMANLNSRTGMDEQIRYMNSQDGP